MLRASSGWWLIALAALLARGEARAASPCGRFEVESQVAFWTGEWQLAEHRDDCPGGTRYVFARKGAELRKLPTIQALLGIVPAIRNEQEALALATFITARAGDWTEPSCTALDPRLTRVGQDAPEPGAEPAGELVRLVEGTDAPPGDPRVDPFAISVSREGPSGPFVVERYLRCPGIAGVALVRETFGPEGRYARKVLRAVASGGKP